MEKPAMVVPNVDDTMFTTRERTVVDVFVTLDGVRFDANDLLDTLCSVEGGGFYTTFSNERFAVLKKYGILVDQGSNKWMASAQLGEHGVAMIDMLERKIGEQ